MVLLSSAPSGVAGHYLSIPLLVYVAGLCNICISGDSGLFWLLLALLVTSCLLLAMLVCVQASLSIAGLYLSPPGDAGLCSGFYW